MSLQEGFVNRKPLKSIEYRGMSKGRAGRDGEWKFIWRSPISGIRVARGVSWKITTYVCEMAFPQWEGKCLLARLKSFVFEWSLDSLDFVRHSFLAWLRSSQLINTLTDRSFIMPCIPTHPCAKKFCVRDYRLLSDNWTLAIICFLSISQLPWKFLSMQQTYIHLHAWPSETI